MAEKTLLLDSRSIYESANRAADKKKPLQEVWRYPFETRFAVLKREKMLLKQELCNIKEQLQQLELKLQKPEQRGEICSSLNLHALECQ